MIFITVEKNVITGVFSSTTELDLSGTPYEKHKKMQIPDNKAVYVGDPLDYYVDWVRLSDEELIEKGIIKMPEGKKIEEGKLVAKEEKRISYILNGEFNVGASIPEGGEEYKDGVWSYDESTKKFTKKSETQIKKDNIQRQLLDIDLSISDRTLRQAALGDKDAIERIKQAEEKAAKLREELVKMK